MGKPPLPEDCPASLLASLSRPRNQRRGKPAPPPLASAADSGYKSGRKLSAFQAEKLKVFCPGKSSSSYRGACFSRFNQQTQPRPFAILPRQGFSWQDGSCATQLHPARGKSLWTPSCSALRFSHEKTVGNLGQRRNQRTKKAGEISPASCFVLPLSSGYQ